eukprot:5916854-Prorocentrum_lima.AAC.1
MEALLQQRLETEAHGQNLAYRSAIDRLEEAARSEMQSELHLVTRAAEEMATNRARADEADLKNKMYFEI